MFVRGILVYWLIFLGIRYLLAETVGQCSLKITYSAHTDLTVKFQSHRSRYVCVFTLCVETCFGLLGDWHTSGTKITELFTLYLAGTILILTFPLLHQPLIVLVRWAIWDQSLTGKCIYDCKSAFYLVESLTGDVYFIQRDAWKNADFICWFSY